MDSGRRHLLIDSSVVLASEENSEQMKKFAGLNMPRFLFDIANELLPGIAGTSHYFFFFAAFFAGFFAAFLAFFCLWYPLGIISLA